MAAEHVQGNEPLIPMPALTLDALRQAGAAVAPSRLPEFRLKGCRAQVIKSLTGCDHNPGD